MFWQRFFVVIIGVPLCYFLIFFGGWLFTIILFLLLALGSFEYARMAFGDRHTLHTAGLMGAVSLIFVAEIFGWGPDNDFYIYLSLFGMLLLSLWGYEFRQATFPTNHFMKMVLGVIIIGWMGRYLFRVRALDVEGDVFLLLMFAIWSADVGAYVFGSLLGRTKIAPNTSPGKSLEGYVLGIVSSCVITPLFGWVVYPQFDTVTVLLIALILSIGVPLGDLCMSMLKRQAGVKDYGGIIPGHGGIMDRLDTILWGIVPGYFLVIFFNLVTI